MSRFMKKWAVFLLAAIMVIGVGSAVLAASKYMTFAAPPATSSYYAYWVALAKAVQETNPEYKVSVSESTGAVDIAKKIRNGLAPLGNSQSNSDYENYHGLGVFEGKPFPQARIMWYFDEGPIMFVVRKSENIKNMKDLDGKRLHPGTTGGATALVTKQMMEVLGVKPDYFEAGQASGADAVTNRQIAGTVKTGQGTGADSYVLQIQASVDIDLVSLTEEELALIHEKIPYLIPSRVPAGTYEGIDHDVLVVKTAMGATTTSQLSQQEGYDIIKAMDSPEGRKIWEAAFPSGATQDFVELTLGSSVPLHSGTIQYLKEKGVEIPERLIPEEYKE